MNTLAGEMLRDGLLQDTSMLLAAAHDTDDPQSSPLGEAVAAAFVGLGARVTTCRLSAICTDHGGDAAAEEGATDEQVKAALAQAGSIDALVVDGASLFADGHARALAGGARTGGRAARDALGACLDAAWSVTRAVMNIALLPAGGGGRIVYLAPSPAAGEHTDAARAGLENLARTLSIEWARHGTTAVAVAPGSSTAAQEVAALVAYLASPAGAYFSGCLLDLTGPTAGAR